jgi:hypothetical protein
MESLCPSYVCFHTSEEFALNLGMNILPLEATPFSHSSACPSSNNDVAAMLNLQVEETLAPFEVSECM